MNYIGLGIDLLAYATVVGQVVVVLLIALVKYRVLQPWHKQTLPIVDRLGQWISDWAIWMTLVVAVVAMAGSLFFSEIAGFVPCSLCWWQRIYAYPQVFILAAGCWLRDRRALLYAFILSVIGIKISIEHYAFQIYKVYHPAADIDTPCVIYGMTPSCVDYFFIKFGYITIPMMCLTAFAMIIMICVTAYVWRKRQ